MLTDLLPSLTTLAAISVLCFSILRGWNNWLDFRRAQGGSAGSGEAEVGLRIEVAALRERVKQLERIASGVEI